MNNKFAIIPLLFITTSVTLFGCNSSTKSITTADKITSTESVTSSSTGLDNHKSDNIQPIQTLNTTSTQDQQSTTTQYTTENSTNNEKYLSPETYISKSGFSMTFPGSWNRKYTVEEDSDGLSVIFNSNDPENKSYTSWMIAIKKSNDNTIPCYGLAIGDVQNFDAKGNHYIVFMPSDLTLDCKRSDYIEYINMMAECKSVINSITVTE